MTVKNKVQFVWSYLSPFKTKLIISLLGLAFLSFSQLIYPWLLKLIVDAGYGSWAPSVSHNIIFFLLIIVFAGSASMDFLIARITQKLSFKIRNSMRADFFKALLNKSLGFHRTSKTGTFTSLITEDIGKIQHTFSGILAPLFQNLLVIFGCIILMSTIHIIATAIVLSAIMCTLPLIAHHIKKFRSYSVQIQNKHALANALFEESLVAIREIKAFDLSTPTLERYKEYQRHAFRTEMAAGKLNPRINQLIRFILSSILLLIFYITITQTPIPNWTIGGSIAFYMYAYSMTITILATGHLLYSFQAILAAIERAMSVIGHADETATREFHNSSQLLGQIAFKNVSFGYSEKRKVISELSFILGAGGWLLIKGPSGSGKSTIASLLMGFYAPDNGKILIDEKELSDWGLTNLRRQIGYVGQDPFLFQGTLYENILLYRPYDAIRFTETLRICCLQNFYENLPDGLETVIGERGFTLSGGQKSRIAIARAILTNPAILILDEANAMLETSLEKELWENLWIDRKDKTTIILSHHDKNIPNVYETLDLETVTKIHAI